ncbi:MAG: riboflavin synthase [Alphaproteobacteria bacterium]|nr:riboflavin synthase [Alphaproteobacteria bacterium]
MFTGIITGRGKILSLDPQAGSGRRLVLDVRQWQDRAALRLGASVACNGICLTVTRPLDDEGDSPDSLNFDLSPETLSCTTAAGWQAGDWLNLERPLRMGDELGGHMVSGHVDTTTRVCGREPAGDYTVWWLEIPVGSERFIVPKGSVTLDGVSLTVNRVERDQFSIAIIPHTTEVTGFGSLRVGDLVNIELDMIAKTLARLALPYLQE